MNETGLAVAQPLKNVPYKELTTVNVGKGEDNNLDKGQITPFIANECCIIFKWPHTTVEYYSLSE
jgi:hypothetical protein